MKKVEPIDLKTVVFSRKDIRNDVNRDSHKIKEMDSGYIRNCIYYLIRKRRSDLIQSRIIIFKDYLYTFLCELAERKECTPFIERVDGKPVVWYKEVDYIYLDI